MLSFKRPRQACATKRMYLAGRVEADQRHAVPHLRADALGRFQRGLDLLPRRAEGFGLGVLAGDDLLRAGRLQQQRERRAGVAGGRAARRVQERHRVAEGGDATGAASGLHLREAGLLRHVADQPEGGEPEQRLRLGDRGARAPVGEQAGGGDRVEGVAGDDRGGVLRRAGRDVVVHDHRRRARLDGAGAGAEVGGDDAAEARAAGEFRRHLG